MTDYQRIILVHYHEIGLKGHNRASFETRLQKNLEALLAGYPVVTIHRISGRICVFLREGTGWDTAVEASELARGVPGAVVAAGRDRAACEAVQEAFMNAFFRVYTTPDIVGAQLGGGLKNVIALAAGVCDGMELGDNTKAALVTRGLTEMARLGVAAGGMSQTLAGLSGLGDLIVTCTSIHSRNYRAGRLVGQGKTAMDAMREVGAVVEGYYAAAAARELAGRFQVEMPISDAVYRVLYEGADARQAIRALLSRQRRGEIEESWLAGGQMEWS